MTVQPEPPEKLCVKLRTAADRLLAGTPLHSPGKLTILDLAAEAQVKRWLLTHKYPNKLMAKYQAEFKATRHKSEPVKKAEAESDKLREELAKARTEKRKLTELVETYALMIEQLAKERAEAIAARDEALSTRDSALGVTHLPTTPPQQRAAPTSGRSRRPLPRGLRWQVAVSAVRGRPSCCGLAGMTGLTRMVTGRALHRAERHDKELLPTLSTCVVFVTPKWDACPIRSCLRAGDVCSVTRRWGAGATEGL